MKKSLIAFLVMVSLMIPSIARATPPDFSGGVNDERMYEEVVFISGEPIKFVGQVSIPKPRVNKNTSTITYNIRNMKPHRDYQEKFNGSTYSKNITYKTEFSDHVVIGQRVGTTTVTKSTESLKVESEEGSTKYDLKDYQFSKSDLIDKRAASDFYSGNIQGEKYYEVSGDKQGTVIVDISGTNSGYENFWGVTETQMIDNTITSDTVEGEDEGGSRDEWTGTVNFKTSDSLTKKLRYSTNDAHHSSFEGGYVRVTNEEAVSKYNYRLPKSGPGTIYLNAQNSPILERLIVPKFRDVNGHWAEDYIKKLYSLDVFSGNSTIFSPDTQMNRVDFTKAVVKSSDIGANETVNKRPGRVPKDEAVFEDLPTSHDDYEYVKSAVEKEIIAGTEDVFGNRYFHPNRSLTRAEAVTILIRALGFENRAPNPGYVTSFADDSKIPYWAKDSIYMAKEMNLLVGDSSNNANPGQELTRSEASALIVRFLEFLENDLQKDYRDNIVNFN